MTQKQMAFLEAMLQCSSMAKASRQAGISPNTATKYMKDRDFKAELDKRRSECLNDTVRFLQAKLSLCSEQLISIIEKDDTSDQTKVNAINAVFANFKAMAETADIVNRLEQIERLMEAGDD